MNIKKFNTIAIQLFIISIVLKFLDVISTLIGLRLGFVEQNPFMLYLFNLVGYWFLLISFLAHALIMLFATLNLLKRSQQMPKTAFFVISIIALVNGALLGVVLNNFIIIFDFGQAL